MNSEALRRLLMQQPFRPLEVHLSSGQVYPIRHPECASVFKNTLVIVNPTTDIVNSCSLIHVTNVIQSRSPTTV